MSRSSGRPLAQLPSSVKYPLPSSGSSAPVFTGDLLPSDRAAGSLDPFALQAAFPPSLVARDCHDYYGSSATPRRPQRTVRLPRTLKGSAGTAGTLPTFTHMPVGRVGAQLYPGGIATRYRNTARGLDRPNRKRSAETIPNSNRDRAPYTAHSRQFRGCSCVSGLLTLIRLLRLSALLPHPARWRRTAARSSGAAPALCRTSGIRLPLSFTRPLRRPGARSLTPPGHMAPRGAVLVSRTRGTQTDACNRWPDCSFGSAEPRSGTPPSGPPEATERKPRLSA